jgi:tRNA 2-thiouridine synthesizing protein B
MLHTVNKSPFEKNSLETCLRLADSNSSILLIEDGVYGALKNTLYEKSIIEAQKK